MIKFTTGNILESDAVAIVNTVNCEGFMGKGIAYQFKLKFPKNNHEYSKLCKSNRFNIGDIFVFSENNKIILNFPTKDKWRKKSEYLFIEKGLLTLKNKIIENQIASVAVPPLGCGNGGLDWDRVKDMIINELGGLEKTEIIIYEPLYNEKKKFNLEITSAPKLSTAHLLLLEIKLKLKKFNKTRLQKVAYLNNIKSGQNYFKFKPHLYGPYSHPIDILSKEIKEYQSYYNLTSEEAYNKAEQELVSKALEKKVNDFRASLDESISIANQVNNNLDLELLTTILYLIEKNIEINFSDIVSSIHDWNDHKKTSFDADSIERGLEILLNHKLIRKNLVNNYELYNSNKTISEPC